jgi:UDP-N-acetylmuramoyl-L-alanyl-D-glutamate--2,6-diaminopimelate ligase
MIGLAVTERWESVRDVTIDRLLPAESVSADPRLPIGGIAYSSTRVAPGDLFFCIRGFAHDGHDFAAEAIDRGAVALVVERLLPGFEVPQYVVSDARIALARASSAFFDDPSRSLAVFGITGTNGKTTSTYLLDAILRADGRTTGLIGTVETVMGPRRWASTRTTPESADLFALLARMHDASVSAVTMEVSSHALDLHRVEGVHFQVAAFTNLTQDHLDYHHTVEEYFSVKQRLFTEMDVEHRVINIDDPYGVRLAEEVPAPLTVGLARDAAVRATGIEFGSAATEFTLVTPTRTCPVSLPLVGAYNVSNALIAAGCAYAAGIDPEVIAAGLCAAPQVPGRLERIATDRGFSVFIDYAHTPDGLAKALDAVRAVTTGRLFVVFGAGGDRDPDKRPMMGGVAARRADHVIVTSDNPRSEDPVGIILQIEDGLREGTATYEVQVDRRTAIRTAICRCRPDDSLLIAGKGHEDYQIFADRTVHFDDREVAAEELMPPC